MKTADNAHDLIPKFKLSNFRSGDIVLSTVQRSQTSAAIRAGTGSRFSHAAIHWRSFTFLEAIGPGVCTFNALVSAVSERENVQVLRLREEGEQITATRAADAAYSLIGREYWVGGALRAPLGVGAEDVRGRLFCSYLVAEAYAQAGIQLCLGKEARFVTPGDLSASPLLVDITDSVLYQAAEHELRGVVRLIDGEDPTTPQTEFRDALARVMARVRLAFSQHGMPTPASLPQAMALVLLAPDQSKQRTLDNAVSEILEGAGYSELPTTVLFRQPVVGFDEQTLSEASLQSLTATITTHRTMLREWISTNEQRRQGLEQGRQQYGDTLPFRVLEMQARHERAHWSAMEANIVALGRNLALMERVRETRQRRGDA